MELPSQSAFEHLAPVSEAYATLAIGDAFTWEVSAGDASPGEWYLVCFRSIRQPHADERQLSTLDDLAHHEAMGSPGFVHYFKGETTARGECLSFCLWEGRAPARAASGRPAHVAAASVVHEMYSSYKLEFYRVRKLPHSRRFEFEPYDQPAGPALH